MNNPLVRCSICKRHVYLSEPACPFCARQTNVASGSIAVALTAAASIALAGCANDPPKNNTTTEVAPEAHKTEATQAAPNPAPAPTPPPAPVASTPEPMPAPSASAAATPTTTPAPIAKDPPATPAPAYGAPQATTTSPPRRPAVYGGPPRPSKTSDPF